MELTSDMLLKIKDIQNQNHRTQLKYENIFVFPIYVCDTNINETYEKLSIYALEQLGENLVGKTVKIFLDSHIYISTTVFKSEIIDSFDISMLKILVFGDKNHFPKWLLNKFSNDESLNQMGNIDLNFFVEEQYCSICGESTMNYCSHIRGKIYDKLLCYYKTLSISDVFDFCYYLSEDES